jgi:competence protein ComEA
MLWFLLALVSAAFGAVDLNTADAAALESLPGIGASKAAAILAYRQEHGAFKSVEELDNVPGIGPSTMANLRGLVTVGGGTVPSGGTNAAPTAPAASGGAGCPVNINAADAAGLGSMPGIGPSKAAAIVQYRTDNGPFASCEALDAVSGIGPATLTQLAGCCVVK